jgi:hypothetical protein
MRTYGRIYATNPDGSRIKPQPNGYPYWVEVSTDPTTGSNAWVWLTTLCQVLLLYLNESPFYAQYGLPAAQAVIQQIAPDYNVNRTQQQFAQYFASLTVARVPDAAVPTYNVAALMPDGTPASATVQVPF